MIKPALLMRGCVFLAVTGCPAWVNSLEAFQAPLTNLQATLETNRFSLTVRYQACESPLPLCLDGSTAYAGTTFAFWVPTRLVSTDGIAAWAAESAGPISAFDQEVGFAVADPARGSFARSRRLRQGSSLSHWEIDALTVRDGVVAWTRRTAGPVSSWESEIGYATYDVVGGTWVEGGQCYGGTALNHSVAGELTVGDGMVAWKVLREGDFAEPRSEVGYAAFDPARHVWAEGRQLYEGSLNETWSVTGLTIDGQSIRWMVGRGDEVTLERRGFDLAGGRWIEGTNTVFAEFFAPTNSIPALTGVWFTDASFGATNWSWDFGDGLGSTARSPRHVYAGAGSYEVVLTALGPTGADSASRTISVGPASEAPLFLGAALADGVFTITPKSSPAMGPLFLLGSSNLIDWVPMGELAPGSFEFSDRIRPDRAAWFYRGVALP